MYGNLRQYKEIQRLSAIEKSVSVREELLRNREELLQATQRSFHVSMQSLAKDALSENSTAFISMAKTAFSDMQIQAKTELDRKHIGIKELVGPLQQSLRYVESKMEALERERLVSVTDMKRQMLDMISAQKELRSETANLVRALRSPVGRGRWGELQLQRVVELAGMVQHCDFVQQLALETNLRPDVIIRLSNNRNIVVDAKTPLMAYLEAYECADEERRAELMENHARQVRGHINALSAKSYWDQFEKSPEFVVMFIPGESIFSAALNADPTLIEYGGMLVYRCTLKTTHHELLI
jgi:DNA recombination protein RmuC